MDAERPWWELLFERDYYDYFAPGGARSTVDPEAYARHTESEAEFIATALDLRAGARVLDLCCGWGRHAIALARKGYAVTGLDISAYHVELAAKAAADAGLEVEWITGDMREVARPDGTFDAVVNMFTAFGYFDDAGNQRVLDEVARVLRPRGRLFMDVINRDYLMQVFRERDWNDGPDGSVQVEEREWDARSGRVRVRWEHIDPTGERRTHYHDERVYSLQELELRLALAGLRVDDAYGDTLGAALERGSRRLVVVATRVPAHG